MIALWHALVQAVTGLELVLELVLVPAAHKPRPHQSTTPHQLCMRSVSMAVVCRANRQAMQQAASTSVPSQLGVLSAASAFNQCGAHRRL